MKLPPAAKIIDDKEPFALELGGTLPALKIAYESWGVLNQDQSNCVLVIPAFSANCHAKSHPNDENPGWWEHMIGPGLPIDTNRHFVVCPSLLGGCHGTTGPTSINDPDAQTRYRGDFPLITIGDIARCHLRLLDALGIDQVLAVCGGSMGAMQALEIGIHHGSRAGAIVAISGTDQTRPATAAIRHLGRRAIMLDSAYENGFYQGDGPIGGLLLAREIGTVFYRSKREFNDRFSWLPIATPQLGETTFDVQSYLAHQGSKMVGKFDANSYLKLSMAMDLHHLARENAIKEKAGSGQRTTFYIGGVEEDRLMTIDEQIGLHEWLVNSGHRSTLARFSSKVGHDAFLVKHQGIADFVESSLTTEEAG